MRPVLYVALLLAGAAVPSWAQEWQPTAPVKDGKDWVQLKSGEWVRGNIDLFRDLEMEFDSDELDDLVIEWDDIIAFRAPRNMTFVFAGQRIVYGPATMSEGIIRITTADGLREFSRDELLSIIEGVPKERNFWSVKASVGITVRTGNTEQSDMSNSVTVKREATRSRLSLDYKGDFSEISGEQSVNKERANLLFDLYISRKMYITAGSFEYYYDKFQNIDSRITFGAGVGYFLFRQSKIEWAVELGGAYQLTRYISVEAGRDTKDGTGAVIPATTLEADITKDIELDFEYRSRIGVPRIKASTHHVAGKISIDFYKDIFELNFSVNWDRVDNPQPYEDGTVPKKSDLKMIFGFGIDI